MKHFLPPHTKADVGVVSLDFRSSSVGLAACRTADRYQVGTERYWEVRLGAGF